MLDRLVKALTANDHHRLQPEASLLFKALSSNAHAALKIVECPGALDELVNGLGKDINRPLQKHCVKGLRKLASCGGTVKLRLLQSPKVTEALVKTLFKDDNQRLQATAVKALRSLVGRTASVQMSLVNAPGVLDRLVRALTIDDSRILQQQAMILLGSLSLNDRAALKITECPSAVDGLVNGLRKDANETNQTYCAKALGRLALRVDAVKERLSQIIEGLLKYLFDNDNHDLEATAVNVLGTLALESDSCRLQIGNVPGLLDRLVKALTANHHHRLQSGASRLFASLSFNNHVALKIAECSGALDELVNVLVNGTNKIHQKRCAQALGLLASLGDSMRLRLIHFPRLIEQLLGALMSEGADKFSSRVSAGYALAELASGDHHMKSEMHNFPGLLETLIDAVKKDDNERWAIYVLTALSPQRGKEIHLSSVDAYWGRGTAETHLGLDNEALADLDEACRLGASEDYTFSGRCYVKAKLSNFEEALVDADIAVEKSRNASTLLERGVLKRMLGDLPGALDDLDESLDSVYADSSRRKYTIFKHRGFIKYLLRDDNGAREDAEAAMTCKPVAVDEPEYGTWSVWEKVGL